MTIRLLKQLFVEGKIDEASKHAEKLLEEYKSSKGLVNAVLNLKRDYDLEILPHNKSRHSNKIKGYRRIELKEIEDYITVKSGIFDLDPVKNTISIERTKHEWGSIKFPLFAPVNAKIKLDGKIVKETNMQLRVLSVDEKLVDESQFGKISSYEFKTKKSCLLFLELRVNNEKTSIKDLSIIVNYDFAPEVLRNHSLF